MMQTYQIPHTELTVTRLGYGCMKIGGNWSESPLSAEEKTAAYKIITTALDSGINFFDHADIYTRGKSEQIFGLFLADHPGLRENIVLQSKCGIRFPGDPNTSDPGRYDFSYEHIVRSVEGSLHRLQTDYLDLLLLHRPDPLFEPEEVARAFAELHSSGKVHYFGVSNHSGAQISLLQKFCDQRLVVNQLELNLLHHGMISEGILVNQPESEFPASAGVLDYCRLHGILVQAWSPVAGGNLINPSAQADPKVQRTADEIARLAAQKGASREAIALGWLLRHPAGVQPLIGTTKLERLVASIQADRIQLSREEWYALLVAARGVPVP